jgi:sugar phosphate isomerase/epimerase
MSRSIERRKFLKSAAVSGAVLAAPLQINSHPRSWSLSSGLKIGLNAYSFNDPLRSGKMDIHDMLEFCAENGFDACDLTAYYFPGYPDVPADEYLYRVKHKAFSLGLEISGTGVRTDFTHPDAAKRKESVALVKNWVLAAEKMGAPVIRVFAGPKLKDETTRPAVLKRLLTDLQECVAFGAAHGTIVAVQNHHDFILTPEHVEQLMAAVDSPWFGLVLDTGGYREGDPYQLIAESIKYAVNWQIKEKIFVKGVEQDTDLSRLAKVIKASDYRGYLPLETLGEGDPKTKIMKLYQEFRAALSN